MWAQPEVSQTAPGESVDVLVTENTNLKHRVQQLTRDHRLLQERLEGARSNLRFADKRVTDLEMQVLELQRAAPGSEGPQAGKRPG
ncbi:hypothetical protein ACH47Z_36085 [Streptomyces sp. NPDC020192]|uniref:hypothetical protein n=1 Tax=Streptomyces sp. NPDC020192 TaxID=3365066 RepID=UPI003797D19B